MSSTAAPPPPPAAARPRYAVQLYFDPALENQVLKAWNVLARRQITTHLIEIASRPHITLLSSIPSPIDPTRLHSSLRSLAARHDPLPLTLAAVGAFPGDGGVLFLAPAPTPALLHLHSQLCEAIKKEGVEVPPESYVPHCTVAQDVPRGRMADAFAVLIDQRLPVSGYGMEFGLVELSQPPVREIFSFPLGSGSDN